MSTWSLTTTPVTGQVIWQWTTTLAAALGAAGLLWVASLNSASSPTPNKSSSSKRPQACWSLGRAIKRVRKLGES